MYTNAGINKVMLAGKISKEPRLHNHNQERWLYFSLVTKEVIYSAKGDTDNEEVHQIRVEETNPALKRFELKKDDLVFVQGKLHTKAFVDAENIKRYKTEIIASNFEILSAASW